jgi:hypothetical protein
MVAVFAMLLVSVPAEAQGGTVKQPGWGQWLGSALPPEGPAPVGSATLPEGLLQHLHKAFDEPWEGTEGSPNPSAHSWGKTLDVFHVKGVLPEENIARRRLDQTREPDTGVK